MAFSYVPKAGSHKSGKLTFNSWCVFCRRKGGAALGATEAATSFRGEVDAPKPPLANKFNPSLEECRQSSVSRCLEDLLASRNNSVPQMV